MNDFEGAFAEVERSARSAATAAQALSSAVKQMARAAAEGDIGKIRKTADRLKVLLEAAQQEIANAREAWPFTPDAEENYLQNHYQEELIERARSEGLQILERDERLIAFPSILRIVPSERAVRVDRKRVSAIRPSRLVGNLKTAQTRKPKFSSERFLEHLFRAYRILAGKDGMGKTIALKKVYEALTLLPGSSSEYDKSDFGRDLYFLEQSELRRTRAGADFSLPASTGTRGSGTFSFVTPRGETVNYYGIRFSENAL